MKKNKNTLTPAEWIVMEALWGREPQVLSEIIESIGDRVKWNYQTYASYLKVLTTKSFVGFNTRGRNKFYYPLVDMDQCIEAESDSVIKKMGRGNARKMLLCMAKDAGLTENAKIKLKELIDELDSTH